MLNIIILIKINPNAYWQLHIMAKINFNFDGDHKLFLKHYSFFSILNSRALHHEHEQVKKSSQGRRRELEK